MIDIRYFLERQNAGRKRVNDPPNESTPSLATSTGRTTVSKAGERAVLDALGPKIEPLTSMEEESYCVIKGTIPPGVSVPLHSHSDAESFYVLSGEAQVLVQSEDGLDWQTLKPGDFVQIPGDAKHAWRNISDQPMEALITTTPKLGNALREMSEPARGRDLGSHGPQHMERLAEISERYGYWMASPEENAELGISL
jgi:quercetin dioxygenase-like cupin family protein